MSFFGDSIRWVASIGFHPLSALPGSGPGRSLGPRVQLRAHLIGFKRIATIYFFFKIFLKKTFFSINFFIKKHDFPSISIIFFAFRVPPCGRPSKSSRIPTVEPDLERSGPSPRAIICGLTNYSNHHYNMNLLIFIPVNPLLYLVN